MDMMERVEMCMDIVISFLLQLSVLLMKILVTLNMEW